MRAFAGLVFPWQGDRVLVCDIVDRGWCIPSGRVEPAEDSRDAVIREAREEAGAELQDLQYIGCYHISERDEVRWADCYTARVASLGEIQVAEESQRIEFMTLDQLPDHYHLWNELTQQVFVYSLEVLRRYEQRR